MLTGTKALYILFLRYLGYTNTTLGGSCAFSNIIFGSYRNQTQEECICLWAFNYISMGTGKETSFNPYLEAPYVRVQLTCALCVLNWVLVKLFNLFDNVIQKYFVFFSFSIYLIWLQSILWYWLGFWFESNFPYNPNLLCSPSENVP